MKQYERFGECLKRCLAENGLSATEAAKLVGFRSRNSIFRILAGETGDEVNFRFLSSLYDVLGDAWSQEYWQALQEALIVERLGVERYESNRAFERLLHERETVLDAQVEMIGEDGAGAVQSLAQVLDNAMKSVRTEIVITGCCDSALSHLLVERCGEAGHRGRLTVHQYIDTSARPLAQHILGILPLVSMPWYNARLVQPENCTPETMALYRMHVLYICCWDEQGNRTGGMLVRFDKNHFATQWRADGAATFMEVLDRMRFDLELLKPMPNLADAPESFIQYTERYAQLEDNGTILSIKPDVHFNCIPPQILYPSIVAGFEQAGIAGGEDLETLIDRLWQIQEMRYQNTVAKHRPTHLVYSLDAMERFMKTGVLTDQLFLQRAYTVEERRAIIRNLLEAMRSHPWFNVHFLKAGVQDLRYEISYYQDKGVLLMDAYTSYDLQSDHSEALITLPAFMESFRSYFQDELLVHYVMSRAETLSHLERLLVMNAEE